MKIKLLIIVILICNLNSVFAQLCGTPQTTNPKIYPQDDSKTSKSSLSKGSSSAICINVFFHIVRNTDGTNAFPIPNTNEIVRELNEFYSPHNILINNAGTSFIDNTSNLYVDVNEGIAIANARNQSQAINYYIVDDMEFNGFALDVPSIALFIRDNRVLTSTSAHELGHCLGLEHTHKGLAYGESGCAEAIDGSNCSSCGDFVCDTPADSGNGAMNGYNPDMTNLMSCYHLNPWLINRDHFTDSQGFRMRAAIYTEPILQNTRSTSCTQISEVSTICYPQTTTVTLSNLGGATTVWTSSSNVQIVSSNNSNATIRGASSYSNGDGWVRAVLNNGITFQENFHVGKAEVDNVLFRNNGAGVSGYLCSSHYDNEFEILPYVPNASYEVRIRDLTTYNIVAGPYNFIGRIATLPTDYNYTPGWYLFEARGTNSCGTSNWTQWEVEFVDCTLGGGGGETEYRVYPNPSSENLTIQKTQSSNKVNSKKTSYGSNSAYYKIFDFNSNLIFKGLIDNQTTIDVSDYKRGNYILKIYKKGKSENHQIIIN
ncbi:zinc-dependent metalloprotease [Mariniflexile sp.]|uniref:zinc-dependent metalloprotease n=1 Tax=Mariniflexile sp. TaxID=1979402 RepID=UPI004047B130